MADVLCRTCYSDALEIGRDEGPPLSLLLLAHDMVEIWAEGNPPPRAVFVCVAVLCGSWVPSGHIMVIRHLDLATGEEMESSSSDRPAIHAALLPQQAPR